MILGSLSAVTISLEVNIYSVHYNVFCKTSDGHKKAGGIWVSVMVKTFP